MKAKKIVSAFLILFLSTGLCFWAGGEKDQEKVLEKGGEKSFIRKDLLVREKIKLGNPTRNIFTPRRSTRRTIERNAIRAQQNAQRSPTIPTATQGATSSLPINIRYIGYVISDDKMVALIVFEGTAIAVERGEVISEGVKIGKITVTEIEIVGSDSQRRRFYLEGEEL